MGIRSEDSEGEIHSPKKDRKKSSSSRVGKKERRDKEKDSKYYSDLSDSEFSGQFHYITLLKCSSCPYSSTLFLLGGL